MGVDTVRMIVTGGKGPMTAFSSDINAADMDALMAYLATPPPWPEREEVGGEAAVLRPKFRSSWAPSSLPEARPPRRSWLPSLRRPGAEVTAPSSGRFPWETTYAPSRRVCTIRPVGLRADMLVTSTGLIFLTGGDAKMRAYDSETGKVLWTAALPGHSRGIPAMYQVNGRQYLIVNASTAQGGPTASENARGYVAFALPEKPAAGN